MFGLTEGLEYKVLIFWWNTRAGVFNQHMDAAIVIESAQLHMPLSRELDRVRHQVEEHLA